VSLTDHLISNLKQRITSMELVPGSGGCFELTVGDQLVYSKLATGEFPQDIDMLKAVQELLG
jgi:selenoprotein W-related protein